MSKELPIKQINSAETAFAFVLGILFNQQVRNEYAWQAPYRLKQRLGTLAPDQIVGHGEIEFHRVFAISPVIHPFTQKMADNAFQSAFMISERYGGDARNIWTPSVSAGEFMSRLCAFPGIGEHKARIALFVATVQLGITVKADGGDYNIRSCASLAQQFHPQDEPILTK